MHRPPEQKTSDFEEARITLIYAKRSNPSIFFIRVFFIQ